MLVSFIIILFWTRVTQKTQRMKKGVSCPRASIIEWQDMFQYHDVSHVLQVCLVYLIMFYKQDCTVHSRPSYNITTIKDKVFHLPPSNLLICL